MTRIKPLWTLSLAFFVVVIFAHLPTSESERSIGNLIMRDAEEEKGSDKGPNEEAEQAETPVDDGSSSGSDSPRNDEADSGSETKFVNWVQEHPLLAVSGFTGLVILITGVITCLALFCCCPPRVKVQVKKRAHSRRSKHRPIQTSNSTSTSY